MPYPEVFGFWLFLYPALYLKFAVFVTNVSRGTNVKLPQGRRGVEKYGMKIRIFPDCPPRERTQ